MSPLPTDYQRIDRLVTSTANRTAQRHGLSNVDDLIQIGWLAALERLPAHDPTRARVTTHLYEYIRGAMKDACLNAERHGFTDDGDEFEDTAPAQTRAGRRPDHPCSSRSRTTDAFELSVRSVVRNEILAAQGNCPTSCWTIARRATRTRMRELAQWD